MAIEHSEIERAIRLSQHCQRNWDLNQSMPPEDLELLKVAVSECPSKQNIAYYTAHFIARRDLIERVHAHTTGFMLSYKDGPTTTNPQTLANLLIIFEEKDVEAAATRDQFRNDQTMALNGAMAGDPDDALAVLRRDRDLAIGVAAGYANLSATLMGYSTGCCSCFDPDAVRRELGLAGTPALLMGIGFKNPAVARRLHHNDHSILFPAKVKQKIEVKVVT